MSCFLSFTWVLQIKDSIISHGCFLRECSIEHSIVGERSRLDSGVELKVRMSYSPISINSKGGQVFSLQFVIVGYLDDGGRLLPNRS